MYIEINDNTTIREIQRTFANFYPYLQMEFFNKPHRRYEASALKDMVIGSKSIGEVKQTHISGVLDIHPWYKASTVEMELLNRFGLSAQILIRDRDHWRQTTGLDDFSLKQLNQLSRNASDLFVVEDYDEGINANEGFDRPVIE